MLDALTGLVQVPWIAAVLAGSSCLVVGAAAGVAGVRYRAVRQARSHSEELLNALERALRGEPREAFEVLRREADRPDAPPALYFALAAALRRLDMTERSAQVHRALLARGRIRKAERVRAQLGLAVDYLQLGRPSLAEDLLKQLPRSVRKHPNLLAVRRKTALEAHDWKEALESTSLMVRRGAQQKSEIADVYARMGQDALANDDKRQALRAFRRALRRDPDNLRARLGLAEFYQRDGKVARARKHLIRSVEQHPALAPMMLRTIRRTLDMELVRDRQRYVRLLEQLAMDESATMWIGLERAEVFLEAGRAERAETLLKELLERYPDSFEVHRTWIDFLADTHREDESLRHAQKLLELAERQIPRYRCANCGYLAALPFLDCPRCNRFGQAVYFTLKPEGERASDTGASRPGSALVPAATTAIAATRSAAGARLDNGTSGNGSHTAG